MSPQIGYDSQELAALCRKWRVRKLALFGSVVRDDFTPESDVDVAVNFDPESHWDLWQFYEMQEELERIFGREVDLVELEAVVNPIRRRSMERDLQVI